MYYVGVNPYVQFLSYSHENVETKRFRQYLCIFGNSRFIVGVTLWYIWNTIWEAFGLSNVLVARNPFQHRSISPPLCMHSKSSWSCIFRLCLPEDSLMEVIYICKVIVGCSLVTQPMLQHRPNRTELRSMDYYHQIFCRFRKSEKFLHRPPSVIMILKKIGFFQKI